MSDAPIIFVLFDEFPEATLLTRAREIDARLFPHFAALESESVWFRNTTTLGVFTRDALPPLLTGIAPGRELLGAAGIYERPFFAPIDNGYKVLTSDDLGTECPPMVCDLAEPDRFVSVASLNDFALTNKGMKLSRFLGTLDANRPHVLYFLHLVFPHSPWEFFPNGRRYAQGEPIPGEVNIPGPGKGWKRNAWLTAQAYQRHLLQSRLADRVLGLIVRHLKADGLYQKSFLVVTADHGVAFTSGLPKRRVRERTLGQIGFVPWLMKVPHERLIGTSDSPAQLTDVLGTIAAAQRLPAGVANRVGLISPNSRDRWLDGLEVGSGERALRAAIDRKYRVFPNNEGSVMSWGLTPARSQWRIGDSLSVTGSKSALVKATFVGSPVPVSESGKPSLVHARLTPFRKAGESVLAVHKGKIVAEARSYVDRGREMVNLLVPPRDLRRKLTGLRFYVTGPDPRRLEAVSANT